MSSSRYHIDDEKDVSIRLITDHIRSATFMISDGIMPTNEGRGYVLRRLIRRAARHGRLLGIEGPFLEKLSETVIEGSKDGYPELEEKKTFILNVLHNEESQFNKTIDQGLKILADLEAEMKEAGKSVLGGSDAFRLYDTYGFPIDLTKEILEEKGFSVDEDGFKKAMEVQRDKARKARKVTNYMGTDATVYESIDTSITTEFVGYDRLNCRSKIIVMTTETDITEALSDGDVGTIIVEQTPFYATMGGQQGDKGIIRTESGEFKVEDTIKLLGGKVGHVGKMIRGMMKTGDEAELAVDDYRSVIEAVSIYRQRLYRAMSGKMDLYRSRLEHFQTKFAYLSPENRLREQRQRLADLENAVQNGMNRKLQDERHRLSVYLERFAGLSPLKKLNQGYSYVADKYKKTLTSVEQVQNGDTIYISVTDGTIEADVTGTVKEEKIYGEERKL